MRYFKLFGTVNVFLFSFRSIPLSFLLDDSLNCLLTFRTLIVIPFCFSVFGTANIMFSV